MDEALIGIVKEECAKTLPAIDGSTLEQRLATAFAEARTSCVSMSLNDQFRGAILAVYDAASHEERRRIDAELRNIEQIAKEIRTQEGGAVPILLKPIGLTDLWKKSKPRK